MPILSVVDREHLRGFPALQHYRWWYFVRGHILKSNFLTNGTNLKSPQYQWKILSPSLPGFRNFHLVDDIEWRLLLCKITTNKASSRHFVGKKKYVVKVVKFFQVQMTSSSDEHARPWLQVPNKFFNRIISHLRFEYDSIILSNATS
jgi:hypothetical protein